MTLDGASIDDDTGDPGYAGPGHLRQTSSQGVTGARLFGCWYFMTAGLMCMQQGDWRRARELVEQVSVSHNHFTLYRDAMQVSAQRAHWPTLVATQEIVTLALN